MPPCPPMPGNAGSLRRALCVAMAGGSHSEFEVAENIAEPEDSPSNPR